jgi:hypothetical protein
MPVVYTASLCAGTLELELEVVSVPGTERFGYWDGLFNDGVNMWIKAFVLAVLNRCVLLPES